MAHFRALCLDGAKVGASNVTRRAGQLVSIKWKGARGFFLVVPRSLRGERWWLPLRLAAA